MSTTKLPPNDRRISQRGRRGHLVTYEPYNPTKAHQMLEFSGIIVDFPILRKLHVDSMQYPSPSTSQPDIGAFPRLSILDFLAGTLCCFVDLIAENQHI